MIHTGINKGNKTFYGTTDFLCDYQSDVPSLPTNRQPGSRALVIENGNRYILNSARQWILQPVTSSEGSGGGGGIEDGDTIIYEGGLIT